MAGFDDIKDKGLISNRGEELLRSRHERLNQKSVAEVRVLERLAQERAKVDKLVETINEDFENKLKEISRVTAGMEELKKVAERLKIGSAHNADKMFQSGVRTALGSRSTNEDISAY